VHFRSVTFATAAMVLLAVTGCGGSDSSANGASDGPVSLSYGVWDKNQVPAMEKLAAAFHTTHPNVTVTVQLTPYLDYFTKLQAAATGGEAPDVFWMNGPNFQLYASNGVLTPLSDLKLDTSKYPASLVNLYTLDGKLFGVPKDMDTVGLWYNKKIFDAADVKYPDDTWTWDTFNTAAKKLTNKSKDVYGIGAQLSGQEDYYNTVFQAGGSVISADGRSTGLAEPAAKAGISFWTDLIKTGSSPNLKQMTDTAPYQMFEAGKIAMYWGGSWDAAEFGANPGTKDDADVAVLPSGVKKATVIHGLANVVSARSKHSAEAKEFAAYLGSQAAAQTLAGTGAVIPAYTGTQQDWVKAYPQFHLQNLLDELPYAVPLPVSKNTAAWNTIAITELTKAWTGEETVDEATAKIATEMNAALAKESK
jgi:multiple sugar transport system substrate-binding protein